MPSTILSDNGVSSGSAGLKSTAGNDGVLILQTTTSGGTATNAVYIDTSQNVGIGTSSPARPLVVYSSSVVPTIQLANATSGVGSNDGLALQLIDSDAYVINREAGFLSFLTANTERARFNTGSAVFCLAGGSTSATGTGIAFPATQSASTDANTLDDYEEGTFTATLTFNGNSVGIVYAANTFTYQKVGNTVHITGYLYLSNKGSSTGDAVITGLPFTVANTTAAYSSSGMHINGISFSGYPNCFTPTNSTTIVFQQCTDAGTATSLTNSNFTNTSGVIINFTYRTSA